MESKPAPLRILFVCLGNICRSPLAEGLFRHKVNQAELSALIECDSCGTGNWHAGESPDERMIRTAAVKGLDISMLVARQLKSEDFSAFDYILAMDRSNYENILKERKKGEGKAVVKLIRDFDPDGEDQDVPDPWFGGMDGFEETWKILDRGTTAFLKWLKTEHGF